VLAGSVAVELSAVENYGMRLLWRLGLAWCVAWGFAGCSSSSDDPVVDDSPVFAEVVGTVTTPDGAALAEVGVQLASAEATLETTSGYGGEFSFAEVVVARAWTLSVEVDGYEAFTQVLSGLTAGESRDVPVALVAIAVDEPEDADPDPDLEPEVESGSEVGQFAPDFTLPDINGDLVTLSSFRGKSHVLVAFHRGVF